LTELQAMPQIDFNGAKREANCAALGVTFRSYTYSDPEAWAPQCVQIEGAPDSVSESMVITLADIAKRSAIAGGLT
jgi:hypothetical protein